MSLDALRLLVIAIFLAKLAFALLVPPNGDEAYYFLWGQHLQWSYRDHAPMVGWGEGLGARLFGWTPLGLRFPTFLTMAGTIFLFRLWARKFAPENEKLYFWTLLGVAFASPMFNFTSTNVFPDHLLVFFVLAALYVLADFMSRRAADANASPAGLYLGAVFLGLAGLSKYSAIFFGLAFVAALLSQKRLRGLFLSPHLYLAGLLAALIVSPIFVWNATHDFASLQLHRQERFADAATPSGFTWMGIPQEIGALLFFSPFLLPAVYLFLTAPAEQGERAQIRRLAVGPSCFPRGSCWRWPAGGQPRKTSRPIGATCPSCPFWQSPRSSARRSACSART
jgi:4-amino-4-deoxy-L-arabinose transferase-like glycosyltransferase